MQVTGSFDVSRFLARDPGIVRAAENNPVVGRRMIEKPQANEFSRGRIGEIGFALELESLRSDFSRIRRDAVDDFETVAVGLVFLPPAEAVEHGRKQKGEHENNQEKKRQGGPIVGRADIERSAPARKAPQNRLVGSSPVARALLGPPLAQRRPPQGALRVRPADSDPAPPDSSYECPV